MDNIFSSDLGVNEGGIASAPSIVDEPVLIMDEPAELISPTDGTDYSSKKKELLQADKPVASNNKGLKLKKKWALITSVIIVALLTLIILIGSIYFTTAIHIKNYAQEGDGDKLLDIVVNSSDYHFLGNSREIQLLALRSLHEADLADFRDAGWKTMRNQTDNELNYKDVLAYSDIEDIKHFAHLYMGVPDAITAEGYNRYKPLSLMVDQLKMAAPNSSEFKKIADIYRQKNIEKVQKDILKILTNLQNIDNYRACQSQLAMYGITFDDSIVVKYEENLAKLKAQNESLLNLRNEKDSIKDPQKYDSEIAELQNALTIKGNQHYYLSGYVIAQLAYSEYEIVVTKGGYSQNSGEVGRSAILETNDTRFEYKTPFRNLPISTLVDNREVQTKDGFWQNWYVYHEVSGQDLAGQVQEKQEWTTKLENAKAEKVQAVSKLRTIKPKMAVLEKNIAKLEKQKSQLIESWNKQHQALTDAVQPDLNRMAADYVDQKIL